MFFLNWGARRSFTEPIDKVQGSVLLASGHLSQKLLRTPVEPRQLLDPQLYLAGLPAANCPKTCARLATYPWFAIDGVPDFDSGQDRYRRWEQQLRDRIDGLWPGAAPREARIIRGAAAQAVEFQLQLRTAYVILPSPLVTEREDEAQIQADWLDAGLLAVEELEVEQPVLATVAIQESVLNDQAFAPAGFLEAVIDQVIARETVNGVYIVVAQDGAGHPFETSDRVVRAYLQLVRAFAARGYETILTNFADVFGLVCLGAGATGVASGTSQTLRRLSLAAFEERAGGRGAYPYLYSHPCVAEFLPESDLSNLIARSRGALRMVRDETDFSKPLFDALARGETAATLPTWAEGANNVPEAHKHFIARFATEAQGVMRLRVRADRSNYVVEWLETAVDSREFLQNRFGRDLSSRFAASDRWLEVFQRA